MSNFKGSYKFNEFVVIPCVFAESKIDELLLETVRLSREETSHLPKTHILIYETHSPKIYEEMSKDELLSHFIPLHFPHKMSSLFRSMLDSAELVQYLAELVGHNVK